MEALGKLYLILLPLVLGSALLEGLWLSRTRAEGYDWKAWATSIGDLAIRRLLSLVPYSLATPIFSLAYQHRLFTLGLDSAASVLLLFVGMEFFYYWYHRTSHTVR
jgi:sterol desaturase/sphingolipid hydroxylase (fatty acid hydroxylase superfamily)